MKLTTGDYLKTTLEKVRVFRTALTKESDRGCALFAASYLDRSLSDLLYLSLVENNNIENDLFEGTAPISSFSARIKMAFYMGKISKSIRDDLNTIRKIRNDFGHKPELISFDTRTIADKCRCLKYSYHQVKNKPRDHFTASVLGVLAHIHVAILTAQAPKEMEDKPPNDEKKEGHRKIIAELFKEINTEQQNRPDRE